MKSQPSFKYDGNELIMESIGFDRKPDGFVILNEMKDLFEILRHDPKGPLRGSE